MRDLSVRSTLLPWVFPALLAFSAGAPRLPAQSSDADPDKDFRASLPDWLDIRPEARARYEGRSGNAFEIDVANSLQTRYLLGVGIRPHRRFRVFAQGMDARMPTAERRQVTARYRDVFDVREAYVEIGDPDKDPFRVIVGRQLLIYGSQRLISHANWSNSRRAFDAARLRFENKTFTIDGFTGSVVNDSADLPDRSDYGDGFHGVYSTWKRAVPGAEMDVYLLYRTWRRVIDELGRAGDGDLWAPGLRIAGKIPAGMDYEIETLIQRGRRAQSPISAWSAFVEAGRRFSSRPAKPRLFFLYQYASGDADPTDGKFGTHDQFFPANHRHRGLLDVIGYRNLEDFGGGVEAAPSGKLSLRLQIDSYRLASRHDAYYTFGGQVLVPRAAGGARSRRIGYECDFSADYRLNAFTTLSAGVGRLFRGGFLKLHSNIESSTFGYAAIEFKP